MHIPVYAPAAAAAAATMAVAAVLSIRVEVAPVILVIPAVQYIYHSRC